MHSHIHTVHTYIYKHTYIHTYIHTYTQYIHTFTHTHSTYIHTYIHTHTQYMHTYIHTSILLFLKFISHLWLFFRCWTQGKPDKLKYLNKAKMWYVSIRMYMWVCMYVCTDVNNLNQMKVLPLLSYRFMDMYVYRYLTDKCSPLESLIVDSKLVDFETEGEWRRSRKRK